jgi:hypothetical protein
MSDDRAFLARRFYDDLSVWAFLDPAGEDMTATERLVLLASGWHGPKITVGRRRLSKMTGLATSTVEAALVRLERRGVMARDGVGPRGVVLRRITIPGLNSNVSATGPVTPADVSATGPVDVPATYRRRTHDVPMTGPTTGHKLELQQEQQLPLAPKGNRQRDLDRDQTVLIEIARTWFPNANVEIVLQVLRAARGWSSARTRDDVVAYAKQHAPEILGTEEVAA